MTGEVTQAVGWFYVTVDSENKLQYQRVVCWSREPDLSIIGFIRDSEGNSLTPVSGDGGVYKHEDELRGVVPAKLGRK